MIHTLLKINGQILLRRDNLKSLRLRVRNLNNYQNKMIIPTRHLVRVMLVLRLNITIICNKKLQGSLLLLAKKSVLSLALGKPEHPGRVRGVGQDVSISKFWPRSSQGASSSKVSTSEQVVISEIKDQIKVMESTFGAKIQELELVIGKLIAEKQPLKEQPLEKEHLVCDPSPQTLIPKSGKASCSAMNKVGNASKDLGWQSCELFWPDLTQMVAEGKLYHSLSRLGVIHNCPLKSGYVKVEVVNLIKGDVVVPCPTEEDQQRAKKDLLQDDAKENALTNESVIGPGEAESEPSSLENYQWILDDFNETKLRKVKVQTEIFQYNHPGVEIGKEEVQRWLERKEVGSTHMILYIRYLFDNHCKGMNDTIKFLYPTQISPLSQSIEQRATYIAKSMEEDVKNKIFVAPYHFRYHWVLIVMNPHLGHAYWIDPQHGNVEIDAETFVTYSYRIKYAKMGRKTPRKETLWHIIKCPQQKHMSDCGYYVLKFMKDLVLHRKNSSVIPINLYGDQVTYSNELVDDIRREWFDYFLSLI